jgi:hypothetical protein
LDISACETFTGSIAIATEIPDSDSVDLDGVQHIIGNLIASESSIRSMTANFLAEISGIFELSNLDNLEVLIFPHLSRVGQIMWRNLPHLQTLNFDAGVTEAVGISVKNTQLKSLVGLSQVKSVNNLTILNNPYLERIEFDVDNVAGGIMIRDSGVNADISFPSLRFVNNISIENINTISPALMFSNGNRFTDFSAPILETINQSFQLHMNSQLENILLPHLLTVGGGFHVMNNSHVKNMSFDSVESIYDGLELQGNFTEYIYLAAFLG